MMKCSEYNADQIPEEGISEDLLTQIRETHWCGACTNCLYTYIMLAPHLSESELTRIFEGDLLQKSELAHELSELAGLCLVPKKNYFRIGRVNRALQKIQQDKSEKALIKHYLNECIRQMEEDLFEDYLDIIP